jgi:hypothetical protein
MRQSLGSRRQQRLIDVLAGRLAGAAVAGLARSSGTSTEQ